jgi:hypothetical protein
MQCIINQVIKVPFTSVNLVTGLVTFTPRVLIDGVLVSPVITYTEIGLGLYVASFTPTSTGNLILFIEGKIIEDIEIVTRTNATILQNLEEEALGSWTWDKTLGKLTLIKANGTTLASFNVVDTLVTASRERI